MEYMSNEVEIKSMLNSKFNNLKDNIENTLQNISKPKKDENLR